MLSTLDKEINIMKKFSSKNIVKLYDVIKKPKYTFLIIELCDFDLECYIDNNSSFGTSGLKEDAAIRVLCDILHGFKELIDQGYIHRDVKPSNILVKSDIFKVADFGFATKADISGVIKLRECCGSPMYEAP